MNVQFDLTRDSPWAYLDFDYKLPHSEQRDLLLAFVRRATPNAEIFQSSRSSDF